MKRSIQEIEDELDQLQLSYIDEEDEVKQTSIEHKFSYLLEEATETDGILRNAAGVTINNWVRES